jgi:phage shock protein A
MADGMGVEQKVDVLMERFGALERKVDAMDHRFDAVDQRFDTLDRKFSIQFDEVRAAIRLVAEGVDAGNEWLDRVAAEARDHHDKQYRLLGQVMRHVRVRVERLEGGRRRK